MIGKCSSWRLADVLDVGCANVPRFNLDLYHDPPTLFVGLGVPKRAPQISRIVVDRFTPGTSDLLLPAGDYARHPILRDFTAFG